MWVVLRVCYVAVTLLLNRHEKWQTAIRHGDRFGRGSDEHSHAEAIELARLSSGSAAKPVGQVSAITGASVAQPGERTLFAA